MRCPNCGGEKLAVKETRRVGGGGIRRRRRCIRCDHTMTTIEQISSDQLQVQKVDRRTEVFDRAKLRLGIARAAVRQPHPDRLSELIGKITDTIHEMATDGTVSSQVIGGVVLDNLRAFDPVTHIRFALTQLGRLDHPRPGWATANDFRRWLFSEYPAMEHLTPRTDVSIVVKRNGRRERFSRTKLETSIGYASKGRGRSDEEVRDAAARITDEVLDELGRQGLVTSGQINTTIYNVLRDQDPVAAIRVASTMKAFESAEEYLTEILSMPKGAPSPL